MLQYALKRLLGAIPTLLLVIVLAFLMVHAAPGGPFDDERVLPPDTREAMLALNAYAHQGPPCCCVGAQDSLCDRPLRPDGGP